MDNTDLLLVGRLQKEEETSNKLKISCRYFLFPHENSQAIVDTLLQSIRKNVNILHCNYINSYVFLPLFHFNLPLCLQQRSL